MFSDDEMIPISALSHYFFCPRRVALLYKENIWVENQWTAEGKKVHENVDRLSCRSRKDVFIARSMRLFDKMRGIYGVADVVEFKRVEEELGGVSLRARSGKWLPVPVEYKRGKIRSDDSYYAQVCAQAFCLESTYNISLEYGYLYFAEANSRKKIYLTRELRTQTEEVILKVRSLFFKDETPLALYNKRCRQCSLFETCMPEISKKGNVSSYLKKNIFA